MPKPKSGYSMQASPIQMFFLPLSLLALCLGVVLISLGFWISSPGKSISLSQAQPILPPAQPVQAALALATQSPARTAYLPVVSMASSPTPTSTPTSTPEPAPAEPDCAVAAPFPDAIQRWCALISEWSARRDLDPNLIAALILVESGGRESAISRSGAVGLMQVMPRDGIAAGFMCPNGPCFANRPTTEELLDPAFNIEYGTGMLAGLIGRYGERDGLKRYGPARGDYSYVNLIYNTMQKYADRWWWLWPLH